MCLLFILGSVRLLLLSWSLEALEFDPWQGDGEMTSGLR